MKTCSVCHKEKEAKDFGVRAASRDGLTAACLVCLRRRDQKRYQKDKPKRVALQKIYTSTPEGKEARKRAAANWQMKNENKRAVHVIFGNAIRSGRVVPQPCFICGEKAQGHHPNYDAPIDVVWLCPKHHKEAHALVKTEVDNG